MIDARITWQPCNSELAYAQFSEEIASWDYDRSSVSIKKEGGLVFDVQAKDSVALRSSLNAITKLMTVHEKIDR